ncbi:PIN domain-containing protein [candidate division WOR-3 bacterium]|nr:PIN domain-containing protein [candidate division WOR-3 bacterium]
MTKEGRLRKDNQPAMYFDSSVAIYYWMVEYVECHVDEDDERFLKKHEQPYISVLKTVFKTEKRIKKVEELRKQLAYGKVKVLPVISPLVIFELNKWYAATMFRELAKEVVDQKFILSQNEKNIGDWLKIIMEQYFQDMKKWKGMYIRKRTHDDISGAEQIIRETWLNSSFALAHGLHGLVQVDLINFDITLHKAWREAFEYAYLQVGLADIIHILAAHHLGCSYIATFDSDFERVKNIIKEMLNIEVICNDIDKMLDILMDERYVEDK